LSAYTRVARTIQVAQAFVGAGGYKSGMSGGSGGGAGAGRIERSSARREDTLTINLRAGGGFIGRFTKK